MTAPSHRGKKLEGSRWKAGQIEGITRTGSDTPRIFYVNAMNLESRAAGQGVGQGARECVELPRAPLRRDVNARYSIHRFTVQHSLLYTTFCLHNGQFAVL